MNMLGGGECVMMLWLQEWQTTTVVCEGHRHLWRFVMFEEEEKEKENTSARREKLNTGDADESSLLVSLSSSSSWLEEGETLTQGRVGQHPS